MANPENKVRLVLKNRNWNVLNPVLNNSEELQAFLDRVQQRILVNARNNTAATGSARARYIRRSTVAETAEPSGINGLRMRFVRAADIGFEMRYTSLRRALDE